MVSLILNRLRGNRAGDSGGGDSGVHGNGGGEEADVSESTTVELDAEEQAEADRVYGLNRCWPCDGIILTQVTSYILSMAVGACVTVAPL